MAGPLFLPEMVLAGPHFWPNIFLQGRFLTFLLDLLELSIFDDQRLIIK